MNSAQAREYDRGTPIDTGPLECSQHTHCTIPQAKERIEKRTLEVVSERVVMIREQAYNDNRPWQSASGWAPRPSGKFLVMQLITDKGYRLS